MAKIQQNTLTHTLDYVLCHTVDEIQAFINQPILAVIFGAGELKKAHLYHAM